MANVCSNDFYIFCENPKILNSIVDKLNKLWENTLYGEISYIDENFIEGYFDSKWCFPDHIFKNFFDGFNDDTIYMRCLSTEYGCNYIAMNIYIDNAWKEEQTFDLD